MISLGWISSEGKLAELRRKVSLNLTCRTWFLFTANCWICLQQGWKWKWFIIMMPFRYDSNETIAKPIPKPIEKIKWNNNWSVQFNLSTTFVVLTAVFYRVFSRESRKGEDKLWECQEGRALNLRKSVWKPKTSWVCQGKQNNKTKLNQKKPPKSNHQNQAKPKQIKTKNNQTKTRKKEGKSRL